MRRLFLCQLKREGAKITSWTIRRTHLYISSCKSINISTSYMDAITFGSFYSSFDPHYFTFLHMFL